MTIKQNYTRAEQQKKRILREQRNRQTNNNRESKIRRQKHEEKKTNAKILSKKLKIDKEERNTKGGRDKGKRKELLKSDKEKGT